MCPRLSEKPRSESDSLGQLRMWHETSGDAVRELARNYLATDGKGHGTKAFARRLFPHKSDEQAYARFQACTDPNAREQFSDEEWRAIFRIGHEQSRHFVAEFFLGPLYELTPVKFEDVAKRAKKQQIAFHLAEAARLAGEE